MWAGKLLKNKLYAVLLIALGLLIVRIDRDATFLIFALALALPLFFSRRSWFI